MWVDLAAWFQSPGGARVVQTAIIPALAILVAGLLAAAIARSAVRATIRRAERVEAASVVAGLVTAARLTVETGVDAASRRRAGRLRVEADVRARLLPLTGAELAADWAAARTDALQQQAAAGPVTAELAELRDRLVEWVGKPSRARRLFPAAPTPRASTPDVPATPDVVQAEAPAPPPVVQQPAPEPSPHAATATPEDRRSPSGPDAEASGTATGPDPEPVGAGAGAVPVRAPAPAPAPAEDLPAWQRTRAGERLQQERSRGRAAESPTGVAEEDAVPRTATPAGPQHPDRVGTAVETTDAEEAVRLEAHQQARHARPSEQASSGPLPAATPAPAWLDTYDDEAHVTQNLDLKTPPPVSASAVRDRGGPGEDLVPRS
ncbi:MAG: hypothetical protein HIU86_08350 [Acidobacteria bacterium]|nr:hypothetical protein [Acidobacteriota bacterium]